MKEDSEGQDEVTSGEYAPNDLCGERFRSLSLSGDTCLANH